MKTASYMTIAITGIFLPVAAHAEVTLDLAGYYRGYAVYVEQDSIPAGANHFEYRRDIEVHIDAKKSFGGDDLFGFHLEERLNSQVLANEIYAYFSGAWGRINLGREDGATYLLQAVIPSADNNIDGIRVQIGGIDNLTPATYSASRIPAASDRLTYLTPKIEGFQAGISYAPAIRPIGVNTSGMASAAAGSFEDIYDLGLQWEKEFDTGAFNISGGVITANSASALTPRDLTEWKTSFNLALDAYSIGFGLLVTDNGLPTADDYKIWSAGLGWDRGPYHLGASYLRAYHDAAVNDAYRTTVGGGYSFGSGVSVRTSIAFGEDLTIGADNDFTQATIGTDIQF